MSFIVGSWLKKTESKERKMRGWTKSRSTVVAKQDRERKQERQSLNQSRREHSTSTRYGYGLLMACMLDIAYVPAKSIKGEEVTIQTPTSNNP
jgi:hypothetical protein